jgi:hemolysin D
VLSVSEDAIARDKPKNRTGDQETNTEMSNSEPKGRELVYAAPASLDRTQMQIEGNLVRLSPGMAATVEIKTGTRAVISYLLSPLPRI